MEIAMMLMFQRLYMASIPEGTHVFSLRECVTNCFYQRNCSSLFYDQNSKTCHLTTELLEEKPRGKTTRDVSYFVWTRDDCNNGYTWRRDLDLCYKLYTSRTKWSDANKTCYEEGSHLVKVNSAGINDLLTRMSRDYGESIWLGASAPKGFYNWTWADGSGLNVEFWDNHEPDYDLSEHCVVIPSNTRWHNFDCNIHCSFVCQRPLGPVCTQL